MCKIYFGGEIITMRHEHDDVEAVLTDGGRIKAVGTLADIERIAPDAERVDLNGKTLLPAFIDSHSHLSLFAQNLANADLSDAESFDDIVRILTAFREKNKLFHGEYIQGIGYDHNRLKEGRHPDKFVLDKVSTDNPIFIFHVSFHMGVANSLALEQAGITAQNTEPSELIGRLPDGEPSGYLSEEGMSNVYMQIMRIPLDYPQLYKQAQQVYLENGICTVQDGALGKEQIKLLKNLSEQGVLKLDTVGYLLINDSAHEAIEENKELLGRYQNHLKIGGYKMLLDGSPQSKTAWLSEPYTDGSNGEPRVSDEEVARYTKQAVDDGIQLLTHCNGDAASEQLLNAYEKAVSDERSRNLRPVMVHSQTVRRDQLERFSAIGMIPSFFVDHVYYWGDVHLKNLGKQRAENISPVGWAEELGLIYTFHQDTPVLQPNMMRTIRTAVARTTHNGVLLGENHRTSVYHALKAITINAAYQYGEENEKGSIENGKSADFVILDGNPLKAEIEKITDIHVSEVVFKGENLYKRKD